MQDDADRELVLRCQHSEGEEHELAFDELYRRHRETVYALAFRVCGDASEALDASQEAFLVLYKKVRSFQFESKFTSWLYRLVVNATIDHMRRNRRRSQRRPISLEQFEQFVQGEGRAEALARSSADEELGLSDTEEARPDAQAHQAEERERVRDAIAQLSPKLRIVIVLRYLQQLSYEDIAETLEVSIGTVKSRLSRAHLALAELLRAESEPASNPAEPPDRELR